MNMKKCLICTQKYVAALSLLWGRWYKRVFFFLFFALCVWIGFVWYYGTVMFHWSDDQKNAYRNSQEQKTTLNQSDFEEALRILDNRASVFTSDSEPPKEIFQPLEKNGN